MTPLQLCNHQSSKMLVLQIKFDYKAVMLIHVNVYRDRYFNIDRQLDMLYRGKDNGHDTKWFPFFFQYHMLLVHVGIAS